MCGLLLYLNKEEGVDLDCFQKALNLQESRGSDDYGIICVESLASKNITDVIPYFGYARQERKVDTRTSISVSYTNLTLPTKCSV